MAAKESKKLRANAEKKRMLAVRQIVLMIFVVFLVIAGVSLIFWHERSYSEKENRMLQQAPQISFDSLTSGRFMTEAEDFVSDQFFLRDGWVSTKLFLDKLMGKRESNGIYLGKNDYLMEPTAEPGESFTRNLAAIKTFASEHSELNTVVSVVPNSIYVLRDYLPYNVPVRDQKEIISQIKAGVGDAAVYVDTTDTLEAHRDEYIYYRSDHHWTSLGAMYAFNVIAPAIGVGSPAADYSVYAVADDFSGTMAATSGAGYVKDTVEIYIPQNNSEYVVEYVGENKKTATIYNSAALEKSNKYEVFLSGNHSLVSIKTTASNEKSLLVIRDSYANCFSQFLLPYYSTILFVDPRYYSDDLERLIKDNGVTDVLILYNVNTFVEDNNLAGVLLDE